MRDLTDATQRGRLILADADVFRRSFNTQSFAFSHALNGHPLFALPRLAQVASEMIKLGDTKKFVSLGGESISAASKFTSMPPRDRLARTIEELGSSRCWLKLSSAESVDPEYKTLLDRLLAEIEQLSGYPLAQEISWSCLTVFLASPHVVTPYHIDHESNFLFQVAGEKDLFLFDPSDRTILSETEIENFYVGNFQAARYREELQHRAAAYRLTPGVVAHHPPLAPHWVRNGNAVSISVSVGFCMRSLDSRGRVYQCNHYLRRLGLTPPPPGKSTFRDQLKIRGVGLLSKRDPTTPEEILFSGLNRLRGLAAMCAKRRRQAV